MATNAPTAPTRDGTPAPDCSCCPPGPAADADDVSNPPGLEAITWRIGTQAGFKRAMLQALAAQPALSRLSTRANDDPAMALIDAWACTLDVLTFYQERIANEGFLRTATERRSVLELARALGHELRPGVAAAADLAFTLETAPGAPLQARVAAGTKVQSVPAQGQLPQAFETGQALQARAAWNALRVQSTQSQLPLALRRNALYLKGAATRLQPGDAVLVVGDERLKQPGSEAWDLRRVRAVRVVPPAEPTADGNGSVTVVTLDSGLGSSVPVVMPAQRLARVFALRTQTRLFGCSAADWRAMPVSLRATYLGYDAAALSAAQSAEIAHTPQWPGFSLSELSNPPAPSVAVPGLRGHYFLGVNFEQPLFSRVDPQIDFASGVETKAWPAGVPDTLFSVRWTAWLQVDTPGDHHFQTLSDDGVRLWIDGRLLIDHWDNHGPAPDTSGAVNLVPGRRYSLRLEYFQGGGASTLRLAWALPGSTAFVTVPASRLEARLVNDVLLDASHPRVTVGSWLALATADYSELYRVSAVSETAVAEFALSARCTRVQLQGENLFERFDQRLRDTAVFAESEELGWAERPLATPVRGRRLRLTSLEPDLQPGRRLAISGLCPAPGTDPAVLARLAAGEELCLLAIAADGLSVKLRFLADSDDLSLPLVAAAEIHTLQAVDHSGEVSVLNLARPVAVPWLPASVRINANVVDASHGDSRQMASQPEVLGAGDGSAVFQAFTLRQGPLTHVSAASPSGTASTLAIRVAGVPWTEVPSLYGALPAARVYTTRLADDGTVTVQFGDGRTGARLPSGAENVQARYRVGLGSAGNLEAGQLSLLLTAQLGVKAVSNPLPSSGGTDGEGLERARRNAPLTVLTLERIVSLQDFEDFAAAYTGIGKARADGVWDGQQRLVVLSLAGVGGAPLLAAAPLWRNLASAIDAARPPHQPLVMAQGQVVMLPLRARLRVQGGLDFAPVAQAVRRVLVAAFGFEARRFAQALAGSELVAVMQSVAGVDHVLLDAFGSGTRQSDLLGDPLGAATARRLAGVLQPAELLVLDPAGIDLTELSA